jgi:hypothetical protein
MAHEKLRTGEAKNNTSISKLDGLVYYNCAGNFRVWFNGTGLAPSMSENLAYPISVSHLLKTDPY